MDKLSVENWKQSISSPGAIFESGSHSTGAILIECSSFSLKKSSSFGISNIGFSSLIIRTFYEFRRTSPNFEKLNS